MIEYNASHAPTEERVVLYNPKMMWDHTNYFGASLLAFYYLGIEKGYTLVYAENRGVNCFFVRNDLLAGLSDHFKNAGEIELLYKKPRYGWFPDGGHAPDTLNRPYFDASGNPIKKKTRFWPFS